MEPTIWRCSACGSRFLSEGAFHAHAISLCGSIRSTDDESLGAEGAWRPGAWVPYEGPLPPPPDTAEIVNSSDPARSGPACAKHFPTHYTNCPVCRDTLNQRVEMGLRAKAQADVGVKHDQGKPRMELLDAYALEQLALVLTFGAQKYEAHNWRKGLTKGRLLGAALRHLFAHLRGEDRDAESGLSHVAHAMCCCMFLLGLEHRPELDDRWKGEST